MPFHDDSSLWARPVAPKRTLTYVDLPARRHVVHEAERVLDGEPGSAAIIGPAGAGKGTVAREIARRRAASGWKVFEASTGEAIAGLPYIGELEGRLAGVARDDGRVLWLLPDLQAALSAGTYTENPHGLLDRLVPLLAAGRLRLLAPCTPAEWEAVVRARPVLRTLVAPLRLEPAGDEDTLRLAAVRLEELGTRMAPDALAEGLELARELLTTLDAPGNLLALVTTATRRLTKHAPPPELTRDDLIPALSEITGLPADLLDERRPLDLAAVTSTFEERVLGQPAAVATLVERIALIKAGLTDPGRPLGVFLFTGPTGTGKTELAKTLARFLFGSDDRLIRVDMSELQTPADLDRLIGEPGLGGGDSLTSAIRRSPFAVVLLDEVEKAHPRAYDLFLQLFDDGRLTDRAGATADFRHAVVIMTANLMPPTAQQTAIGFAPPGSAPSAPPAGALDDLLARVFRPEFLNRIDRVVEFRPLSREVMRGLVAKELHDVTRRRGLRTRPWAVEWDDSAIDVLLREGFSPTLGARPLKRAVEELVLGPLAAAIVEHRVPREDHFLFVRSTDGRTIEAVFVDPDLEVPVGVPATTRDVRAIALDPDGSDGEVVVLHDELERIAAEVARPGWARAKQAALRAASEPGFWESPDRYAVLAAAEQRDRIEAALETAHSLLARLVRARAGRGRPGRLARLLALRLVLLDLAIATVEAGEPADAFVMVHPVEGARGPFLDELVEMYRRWATRRGMQVSDLGRPPGRPGAVLAVSGLGALRVLGPEHGLHVFEQPAHKRAFERTAVRVTVAAQPVEPSPDGRPARRRLALKALGEAPSGSAIVRRYRREPSALVRDGVRGWRSGRLERVLDGDFDLIAGD